MYIVDLELKSMHIEVIEDDVMYNFYEIFEIAEEGRIQMGYFLMQFSFQFGTGFV